MTLEGVLVTINNLLNLVVPIVMVLALIYFFWGLAKFILNSGDEEKKGEGRNIMIYGIIALFVMISVWGVVEVLNNTFLGGQSTPAPRGLDLIPNIR